MEQTIESKIMQCQKLYLKSRELHESIGYMQEIAMCLGLENIDASLAKINDELHSIHDAARDLERELRQEVLFGKRMHGMIIE
jgi:hypothetical protein